MLILIKDIQAKQILTSKKTSTIEVILTTAKGRFKASVPAGVSTGAGEAVSLPAKKAIENIGKIIKPAFLQKGTNLETFPNLCPGQKEFDDFLIRLDGTANKSHLGANAILALSIAFYRAIGYRTNKTNKSDRANSIRPMFNLIEGGRHAGNELDIQEFLVCPRLDSFAENLKAGKRIQKVLGVLLKKQFGKVGLGDEGGFASQLKNTKQALGILIEAIDKAGYAGEADIALDIAASHFYKDGKYFFEGKKLSGEELAEVYTGWLKKYPIISLEDPFAQRDFASWQKFSAKCKVQSAKFMVVGDDLTCTNLRLMQKVKDQNLCNAVIIKPNQIGTVAETLAACELAKKFGWKIIVSHRAAETNDSFIADLAVIIGADFIKSGAPGPKERMAKYNRLKELLITNY